jgi:hypothetical protein
MDRVDKNSSAAYNNASGKNPFTKEFGTFVRDILEEWKVPGMSLAVIDGEDIYAEVAVPDRFNFLIHWVCQKY